MKDYTLGTKILCRKVEADNVTKGGLIIPSSKNEPSKVLDIIVLGDDESCKRLREGQRIITSNYAGVEIKVSGEELLVIDISDILLVLG